MKRKFNPHKPKKIIAAPLTEEEQIVKNMMPGIVPIADQMSQSYDGGPWYGDSLQDILEGITAEQAAAKPLANAHSIWEIVLHITAWEAVVRRRIMGEALELSEEEDWPPGKDKTDEAWTRTLKTLMEGHAQLRTAVMKLDDGQLTDPVRGCDYDMYFMLHGVIQHDVYHSGQISLLKKAQM